ncbi:hypothetical protein BH10PSE16_BH10PSE16_43470 [soil metagenome]
MRTSLKPLPDAAAGPAAMISLQVQGNPGHPQTGGVLCNKVSRYATERTGHAGRLLQPLRRTSPKGSGQFEPVFYNGLVAVQAA